MLGLWILNCEHWLNRLTVGEHSRGTLGRSPESAALGKALGRGAGREEEPCQIVLRSFPQLQGKSTDTTNTPVCSILMLLIKTDFIWIGVELLAAQDWNFTKISAGYQLSLHVISYKTKIQACGGQTVLVCLPLIPSYFFFSLIQTKKPAPLHVSKLFLAFNLHIISICAGFAWVLLCVQSTNSLISSADKKIKIKLEWNSNNSSKDWSVMITTNFNMKNCAVLPDQHGLHVAFLWSNWLFWIISSVKCPNLSVKWVGKYEKCEA